MQTQEPPLGWQKFNWRLIFTEGIRCQELPGISFPSIMRENNILLLHFHYYSVHGMEEMMFQKEIMYCHEWIIEAWRGQKQQKSTTHSETLLQLSIENY